MTNIKKVISFLNSKFPFSKTEEWDKTGLQYGSPKQVIKNILVALDLTTEVLEKAVEDRVDLIIVHHPFMWEDTIEENFENAPYKQSIHNRLLNTGIGVLVLHTNYDSATDGTSLQVAKRLSENIIHSKSVSYAHIIEEHSTTKQIENKFIENFGNTTFVTNEVENKVFDRYAVLPGSGDIKDIIKLNQKEDIELFVTSDIKWSDWVTIEELKLNVIEITHAIESVFVEHISSLLNDKFKDIDAKFEYSQEIGKL